MPTPLVWIRDPSSSNALVLPSTCLPLTLSPADADDEASLPSLSAARENSEETGPRAPLWPLQGGGERLEKLEKGSDSQSIAGSESHDADKQLQFTSRVGQGQVVASSLPRCQELQQSRN